MNKRSELTDIPAGSRIRVGAPAERPQEAIDILLQLFAQNRNVVSARLGLMEIFYPDGRTEFSYTIGIECSEDATAVTREAIDAISTVRSARWPISVVPAEGPYFSKDAIVFYSQNDKVKKPFKKMLKKLGLDV
jgi:hypothetical protein